MRPAWLPKGYLRGCALAMLGIVAIIGIVWLLVAVAGGLARLV
jgi:hypothetical protein